MLKKDYIFSLFLVCMKTGDLAQLSLQTVSTPVKQKALELPWYVIFQKHDANWTKHICISQSYSIFTTDR